MRHYLASLIGMLLTDGGVSKISKNRFEIYVTSNSSGLRNEFKQTMQKLFGVKRFYNITGKTVIKIRAVEEAAGYELLKLTPTFRTRPCNIFPICPNFRGKSDKSIPHECNSLNGYPPTKIPDFIMDGNFTTKRAALRSAMSGDGGIEFHKVVFNKKSFLQRRLMLRCHNNNLLAQWNSLFEECGFNTTKTENEIRISGLEQFKKYKEKIGFLPNVFVERSKIWNGFEKNRVLTKLIESF